MAELRSHGIVLRGRDWREADRMVTILTRDAGKVTVIARGVKRTKSRFAALVEPLTLGHFLLHRGKNMDTLIQGDIVKSYGLLRRDLLLLAYGQYFCELCERVLPEGEPALPVFTLLVASLETLEKDGEPARVARCFELSLLQELGLQPALDGCGHCGETGGPYDFDTEHGTLLCRHCPGSPGRMALSGAAVAIMKRFLEQGFHRLSVCNVSAGANGEIAAACAGIFRSSLGIGEIKSRNFLETLQEK
jgi:DNA repair protein RecO (recombination protein O)